MTQLVPPNIIVIIVNTVAPKSCSHHDMFCIDTINSIAPNAHISVSARIKKQIIHMFKLNLP